MEDYNKWEIDVIGYVCEYNKCYFSDAAAIIEANEFFMSQCWGKGMSAESTAKKFFVHSNIKNTAQ